MNREVTAHHEAGHAIAAWRKRVAIKSVSIRPKAGEYHGRMIFRSTRWSGFEMSEQWAERRIICALAGPIAQRRFAPKSVRGWHGEGDYEFAAELAFRMQGSGTLATAWLKWLQTSTESFVEANWQHIETLARRLLDDDEIDGNDVVTVLLTKAGLSPTP